jgi:pimeloyl-ACP methyl ester carboxylesterase
MTANADPVTGRDAVVIIPGVMGSELVETATGRTLWGLADASWYASAWTTGASLASLAVTDEERAGQVGRITARRLLRFPAFAPMLRGFEPYTSMTQRVRRTVRHAAAVLEFPYDWRLSVEHNAHRLVSAAERHLDGWRAHPDGHRDARLVLVAHSMGGLVATYFVAVLGWASAVRAVVTLGTPFYGAAKVAHLLSTGRGAPLPLPRRRLRALALTLPGLYDLLPSYRCVDEGTSARRLTASDVRALGGDGDLAAESFDRRERLLSTAGGSSAGLRPLVGIEQETVQSLVLVDGVAEPRTYTCQPDPGGAMRRVDRRGDGTVYRESASLPGLDPLHLPQTHGALAARAEGIAHACAVVTSVEKGPWLAGAVELGLCVPDLVAAGEPFDISVSGCADPAAATCRVSDAADGRPIAQPLLVRRGDDLTARVTPPRPGLYRVEVKAGGLSAVSELVLAHD